MTITCTPLLFVKLNTVARKYEYKVPFLLLVSPTLSYYSVQTLLSSRLLSKNLKVKIYKGIILAVVLCGCETWSLTLREECRLRVFVNRILAMRMEILTKSMPYEILRSSAAFTRALR